MLGKTYLKLCNTATQQVNIYHKFVNYKFSIQCIILMIMVQNN